MTLARTLICKIAPAGFVLLTLCQPTAALAQTLPVAFSDRSAGIAAAPTLLSVMVDFATVLRIDADISAIAVGNAAIADANIVDPNTLILTGHTAGTTNLIAIDDKGTVVLDVMVRVGAQKPGMVTVRRGTQLETSECRSGNCSTASDDGLPAVNALIPASAP